MPTTAGTSSATMAIRRQFSSAIVSNIVASMITLSSITNSSCTYSALTASVSLVTRLTSAPVMARSKNAIGSRSTWP